MKTDGCNQRYYLLIFKFGIDKDTKFNKQDLTASYSFSIWQIAKFYVVLISASACTFSATVLHQFVFIVAL